MRRAPSATSIVAPGEKSALPGFLWFGLLCVALFAAPWLGGMLSGVGPAVARSLIGAAGIAWVVDRWGRWNKPRPAVWLWAFAGWSLLTMLQGANVHDSLMALSNLVSWATLATLAADAAREPRRRDIVVLAILLGLVVVSFQGVWDGTHNVEGWRVFGPFATPNLYAGYLITALPLAILGSAIDPRRQESSEAPKESMARRLIRSLPVLVALWLGAAALVMTASKGAIAALAVAVLLVFLVARLWRFVSPVRMAIPTTAFVAAVAAFGGTLLGRVGAAGAGEAHSGQFRVLTWEGSARMAAQNPILGTGIGTFGSAFNKYAIAGWTEAAHNAYLQTAAETGFPGLLLFLAALGSAALWLFRAARSEDRTAALLGAVGLAGLLAAAAHNLVDYGWTLWAPSAVLWALVGLGVGEQERAVRPLSRLTALGMLVPLGGVLLGGILVANAASLADPAIDPDSRLSLEERVTALRSARGLDPLDADLARRLGVALARVGDQEAAILQLKEATRLAPYEPTAWRYLGEAYRNTGHPDQARAAFARGLENAPKAYKLLLEAAEVAEETGRRDEAIAHYRRIVQVWEGPAGRYPATPELVPIEPILAYAALAAEADRTGDPALARQYRESLVALAERYESNRAKYSLIWQATGQDDQEALEAVRSVRAAAERALGGR